MKEIKFRAWDYKKMNYNPTISDGTDGGETSSVNINIAISCFEFILMQYTGIKDKKGVEIYEGDITDEGHVYYHNDYLGFFVKLNKDEYEDPKPLYDFAFVKVIGNIYENPELLSNS